MYNNYGAMPYYQPFIPQQRNYQPQESYPQNYQQPVQNFQQQQQGIQGKLVDSIDTARVMETNLDGSTNYFPLTDGSAIVTKQLQKDGTSKMTIYKPAEVSDKPKETPKYVTEQAVAMATTTKVWKH